MYMRRKRPSSKVRQYAWGLMKTDESKKDIALAAGYSASMARVPQVIEATNGYRLAMAEIATHADNYAMNVLFALNKRDMTQEDTKTLLYALDTVSRATERYLPKQKTQDNELLGAFSRIVNVSSEAIEMPKSQEASKDLTDTISSALT
jgi:hypothetical protein